MADDTNGKRDLARLRRRQQPDNTKENPPSPKPPKLPSQSADPSPENVELENLERRVLGAVRQAVTDAMHEGRQPAELPSIDMDFVAATSAPNDDKSPPPPPLRPNNPLADIPVTDGRAGSATRDLAAPRSTARALTVTIACAVVGFCALAVFVALQVDDWRQLGVAGIDQPVHPVAEASSPAEVARLSQTEETSTTVLEGVIEPQEGTGAPDKRTTVALATNLDAQRAAAERKRLEVEELEKLKRAAEEKAKQEAAERQRREAEEAEQKRLAAERAAEEKTRQEAAERQRREAEEAERKRLAAERAAEEKARQEAAERQRREAEEAERKRLAAERAAEEKARQEAAERQRREAEEAERKRLAAERAAEEKAQQEAAERQRREAEETERKRLAAERAAEEKAKQEAAERERREAEEAAQRLRIAALREAQQKAEKERAEQERQAAERAALKKTLAEIGVSDPKEIEDLATAAQDQLRSESVLTARLNAILAEVKEARERSNAKVADPKDLPLAWTIEEKARLKLEQLLSEINDEKQVAAAPQLRAGPTLVRNQVTLKLKDSNLRLTGELKSYSKLEFVIELPSKERMTLPTEHFDCFGRNCPKSAQGSEADNGSTSSR